MNRITCILSIALSASFGAYAQTYPAKSLRILVPFAPGGSSDIQARLIAQKLIEAWGQGVVIDNRGGAGGIVAAEIAAHAPADGYTLFLGHIGTQAANPALYTKLPYDPAKDFAAVVMTITQPMILVVPPASAVNSVADLIALARGTASKLAYASAGNGSPNHLAGEMFKSLAKIDATHVPYKGSAPAELDVMAGRVQFFFDTMIAAMPLVNANRLKALAVTSAKRAGSAPNIPTVAESGVAGYEFLTWNGFFVPAGTPAVLVTKLNAEVGRILRMPDLARKLTGDGAEIAAGTPQEFARFTEHERQKLARVIAAAGIHID
ncbi:MAG: protein bugT-like protein [Betaproteobacteria bacterium]|nr:protein bugT-like protein [Betaproteobacteria bacterium]